MLKQTQVVVVLLLVCVVSQTWCAQKFYVSPFGEDSNDGTSQSTPFRSLSHAMIKVTSGDTVVMMDGLYSDFGLNVAITLSKAINLQSLNGPDTTILWCENNRQKVALFVNADVSITGIKFLQCGKGLSLGSQARQITVEHCVFDRNTEGITVSSSTTQVNVRNSEFHSHDYAIVWRSSFSRGLLVVSNTLFKTNERSIEWTPNRGVDSHQATITASSFIGSGQIVSSGIRLTYVKAVTIQDCTFKDLYSTSMTGTALSIQADSTYDIKVTDCQFSGVVSRTATAFFSTGQIVVNDCSFIAGSSTTGEGGAIYAGRNSNLTMERTTVSYYKGVTSGAGVYADELTMTDCAITHNVARSMGGGVYIQGKGTWKNVLIADNTAINGGGVYFAIASTTLRNVTFNHNNSTAQGGGLFSSNSRLQVLDSAFTNNIAGSDGAGMYFQSSSVINAHGTTFANNTARGNGGGFYCSISGFNLFSCTVNNNHAQSKTDGFYCDKCDHLLSGSTINDQNDCPIP